MKKTIIIPFIVSILLFSENAYASQVSDGGPNLSNPEIIHDNNQDLNGNRDNTFPFSISYDETDKALVISYDQDRPASLDLTDRNGVILTHQSINTAGTYYMEIPQETGRYYLFMTTPEFYAYITISFTL